MTFGSLFFGVGGIDLGLERAGMTVRWQVEIDGFATKVLERHWPDVVRHRDVRDVGGRNLERVDCIAGGFPCQDVSLAGKGAGLAGARSGLWWEFARIAGELRPTYVLLENVPGLVNRGLEEVLGSLSELGYDAEWTVLSAAQFGAPHLRKRLFLVAHAQQQQLRDQPRRSGWKDGTCQGELADDGEEGQLADGDRSSGSDGPRHAVEGAGREALRARMPEPGRCDSEVAHGHGHGRAELGEGHDVWRNDAPWDDADGRDPFLADADADGEGFPFGSCFGGDAREELEAVVGGGAPAGNANFWRFSEPGLGGAPDGVSVGLHQVQPWERGVPRSVARARGQGYEDKLRLGALGNSVVPQIVEFVGRRLVAVDRRRRELV